MIHILIVKLSSMGDIIHAFPALYDLKRKYPDAQIDWLVDNSFSDIPQLHPLINKVFSIPLRKNKKRPFHLLKSFNTDLFKDCRKNNKYDYIIDAQGLLKSALLSCFFQGNRHGYDKISARESSASFLYNNKYKVPKDMHAIDKIRVLFSKIFDYQVDLENTNYGLETSSNQENGGYFLFLHGTSRASKMWPKEHWRTLQEILTKNNKKIYIPWASDFEYQQALYIANMSNNVTILPKSSLASLSQVIANAAGVFGGDTGLTHLAAAYNVPIVSLYNQTTVTLASVKTQSHIECKSPIKCVGCTKKECRMNVPILPHCMALIKPDEVWQAMETLLS